MIRLILLWILRIAEYAILIRCVLSFIPNLYNTFTRIIYQITDPILKPIQNMLDRYGSSGMMFDFSPLAALLIIYILQRIVVFLPI